MDLLKQYLLENWALILVLLAFVIMLMITVFLSKKTIRRLYILIAFIFLLSISVFFEFHLLSKNEHTEIIKVLVAIRYSATPFIISLILFALVKQKLWYVIIPAFLLAIINFISIFTGIVFSIDVDGNLKRGVLGYLPYIVVGAYCIILIYTLLKKSNKQPIEIIPIAFLAFSFFTGLIFPLILGKDYSKIFCSNIGIAVFVYYVFLILELTKKDPLTGLLNRQTYYSTINSSAKDITAIISIDMNGLKKINDTQGHLAGDEAIITVSSCFLQVTSFRYTAYRIGGDEFIIICKKTKEEELMKLIDKLKQKISETKYTISIGYSFSLEQDKDIEKMVKESDDMMYQDKALFYQKNRDTGNNEDEIKSETSTDNLAEV